MSVDLKALIGQEDIPTFTYYDVTGEEHKVGGSRFPIGQSANILQEFTRLAKEINFPDHWRKAMEISEKERENYRGLTANIGPAPIYPDDALLDKDAEEYDPNLYEAQKDKYDDWYRKIVVIPTPRRMLDILQENLIPELIKLIDIAPDVLFKMVAYTITPYRELKQSHKENNYDQFISARIEYCEENLDLPAVAMILVAMFKLVGVETFFKVLQSQILNQPMMAMEEPETTKPKRTRTVQKT